MQRELEMDWAVEDIAFTSELDGSEQRYVRMLPPGFRADGQCDLMVALHGHGSDRWQFAKDERDECRAARDFAARHGMAYISPDYRSCTSWMGPAAEADVVQAIALMKHEFNIRRVFVCGGSMGGTSALTFAGLHSRLVDGVVAMNPAARPLDCTQFLDAIAEGYGGTPEEIPDEYARRAGENMPDAYTMPVAITVSGQDKSVPPQSARRLAAALAERGAKCLLVDRPELGHFTVYKDAMEAFEYMHSNADKTGGTIRDSFWIWGHEAGCLHKHQGNMWKLPGNSTMTPAQGAEYLGIPNIFMVRFANSPSPPFREHTVPLAKAKRVVWSIVGDSSSSANDTTPDIEEVISISKEFPNICGGVMDDFFRSGTDSRPLGRYTPQQVREFRDRLHSAPRPMELSITLYAHNLDDPISEYLEGFDVITLWLWRAAEIADLTKNLDKLDRLAPSKRKLLGIYMWDFGDCKPVPMDAMEAQCSHALKFLEAGRIDGLIFHTNCIVDLNLEAVEYARKFIAEVGDRPLPALSAGLSGVPTGK